MTNLWHLVIKDDFAPTAYKSDIGGWVFGARAIESARVFSDAERATYAPEVGCAEWVLMAPPPSAKAPIPISAMSSGDGRPK